MASPTMLESLAEEGTAVSLPEVANRPAQGPISSPGRASRDDYSLPSINPARHVGSPHAQGGTVATSTAGDCIPSELLLSLKRQDTPGGPRGKLSPVQPTPKPASMWNYPQRRNRLKHLVDQPPCVCGAGRDISFLYDAVGDEKSRKGNQTVLPDTLIPEEYHLVKNPGVVGLEFFEDSYTTRSQSHDHHMTIFPSTKPSGRLEVIALKQTLDHLLKQAGIPYELKDSDLKGPTQLHNLMTLVKKEQDIYNLCFHELIRQVSVQCVERGSLLSDLRRRYSNLLNRIPRQVKSLHNEVMAQRALDRRLTSELERFKTTINTLTDQLATVKENEVEVTEQSREVQESLASALSESEKNASLLAEYHELYELQRKRLEEQIEELGVERDVWQNAAYSLSRRVVQEYSLLTFQRLQLCEKSWCRTAQHFAILLSDKDTQQLSEIQELIQKWKVDVVKLKKTMEDLESNIEQKLKEIQVSMQGWVEKLITIVSDEGQGAMDAAASPGGGSHSNRDGRLVLEELWTDIRRWLEVLNQEAECYNGEALLSKQESLLNITKHMEGWTEIALEIFIRNKKTDDEQQSREHGHMLSVGKGVDEYLQHCYIRLSGENGMATGFIQLITPLETWDTKLNLLLNSSEKKAPEWTRLKCLMEEWSEKVKKMRDLVAKKDETEDQRELGRGVG